MGGLNLSGIKARRIINHQYLEDKKEFELFIIS